MCKIEIYEDKEGNSELKDWLRKLKSRKDKGIKEARITLNQIHYCIERIKLDGTFVPEEIAKHIVEDIWEIRPDEHRIMFFVTKGKKIVLLSYFRKDTNRTPMKQIEKARKLRDDWKTRNL